MDEIKWVLILVVVQFLIGIFNTYVVTKEDLGMEKLMTEIAVKDSVIAEMQVVKDSLAVENAASKRALKELLDYERNLDNRVDEGQSDIERIVKDTTVNVDDYLRYLQNRDKDND